MAYRKDAFKMDRHEFIKRLGGSSIAVGDEFVHHYYPKQMRIMPAELRKVVSM